MSGEALQQPSPRGQPGDKAQSPPADPKPRITFACPACHAKLTAFLSAAGRTVHCSNCKQAVQIPSLPKPEPPPSPRPPAAQPSPSDPPPGSWPAPVAAGQSTSEAKTTPQPPPSPFAKPSSDQPTAPEPLPVIRTDTPRQAGSTQPRPSPMFGPRSMRQIIHFGLWLGLGFGGLALPFPYSFFALLWLIGGHYVVRLLNPYILAELVSHVSCPGCGEVHELVDQWECSCGYKDHRQQHALSFRCPSCGSGVGHMDCPSCGVTILL